MLKPFQIRHLHVSPSQDHESPRRSAGTVQISSTDYDELASNYPRARLTYLDDDDSDGDKITVGSSLELSQRLDEPPATTPFVFSGPSHTPMHIFDIRRSNSITELWRQYETTSGSSPANNLQTEHTVGSSETNGTAGATDVSATTAPGDDSRPLLSAFEAELANLMGSAEASETMASQPENEPAIRSSTSSESQRNPHPAELLAAQIMHHLVNGVNLVHSELSSKLPELQRQVRNAQRSLPDHVSTSLQSLLTTLEAHMKTAYNNLPNGGRQLAEEAIHAGRPVAENAADSLRMVASEFNEVGRTLFTAFENEFGRMNLQGVGNSPNTHAMDPSSPPVTEPARSQPAASYENDSAREPFGSVSASFSGSQMPSMPHSLPPVYPNGNTPHLQQPWTGRMPPPMPGSPSHLYHHGHPPLFQPSMYWPRPSPWGFPCARPQAPLASSAQGRNTDPLPSPKPTTEGATVQIQNPDMKTLFIGNVGFNVTEKMIRDVFASKGFIVDVVLPLDTASGKHAGFGYMHFPSIHPAMAAMDVLQGAHIDGHAINLEFCDYAPSESLRSPQETISPSEDTERTHLVASEHSDSKEVAAGAYVAPPNPQGRGSRRKSVAFQEPALPVKGVVPYESKEIEPGDQSIPNRSDSPPLIDLMPDEAASASHQAPESDHDKLLNLNPELEMSRFPPVSQLEAQLLSKQSPPYTGAMPKTFRVSGQHSSTCQSPYSNTPKSLLRPSRSLSTVRDTQAPNHAARDPPSLDHDRNATNEPTLRRSNTMTFTSPRMRYGGQSPPTMSGESHSRRLRRRASERAPLRTNVRSTAEADTWARLDRRERTRLNSQTHETLPGSFPVESEPQPTSINVDGGEAEDANIRSCVSSLIDMGYGTAHEGGRSRMAVYAAASNGSLLDAIEMIEEERKVYASHGRQ